MRRAVKNYTELIKAGKLGHKKINGILWPTLEFTNMLIDFQVNFVTTIWELENNILYRPVFFEGAKELVKQNLPSKASLSRHISSSHEIVKLIFKGCLFTENVYFFSSKVDFVFETSEEHKTEFLSSVNFMSSTLKGKLRFYNAAFKSYLKFDNTRFEKLIDFWNSTFNESIVFYKVDFLSTVVFAACRFNNNILFTYSLFKNKVIFRGATFYQGLDLSNALIDGDFNFFDIKLNNFNSVNHNNDESSYNLMIETGKSIPTINKRETFRIIKQYFYDNGDELKAVEFAKYEKETIKEITKQTRAYFGASKNSCNLYLRYTFEQFSLWLNKWSNDYKNSYLRGGLFTVGVCVLFSLLSYFSMKSHFDTHLDDLNLFFQYLNPVHKPIQLSCGVNSNTWLLLSETFGRIFIGYGIYQTIQAFRKLK